MATTNHESSTQSGRNLCETLHTLSLARLPDLKIRRLPNRWCALAEEGGPKLCWISHYKTLDEIQIWPLFDYRRVDDLKTKVASVGLPVTAREGNLSGAFAARYPLPIKLQTNADVEKAIEVLVFSHSFIGSKNSRKVDSADSLAHELDEEILFPEGGRRTISINAYERSPAARRACIRHFGAACVVCGFNFESHYGSLGKGFIHVHHIVPLGTVKKSYEVDPKKDLRPVCPNCHEMLHRRNPPLEVKELKDILLR
jgi:hypothetical protein